MEDRGVDLAHLVDGEFWIGAGGRGRGERYAACVGGLAAALGVEYG